MPLLWHWGGAQALANQKCRRVASNQVISATAAFLHGSLQGSRSPSQTWLTRSTKEFVCSQVNGRKLASGKEAQVPACSSWFSKFANAHNWFSMLAMRFDSSCPNADYNLKVSCQTVPLRYSLPKSACIRLLCYPALHLPWWCRRHRPPASTWVSRCCRCPTST